MLRNKSSLYLIISLLLTLACAPEQMPQAGGGSDDKEVEAGGDTPQEPQGNLVGTITNAETGEPVAGVPVTDGYTYTVTDADGKYRLQGHELARTVYMSVPADYEIPTDESRMPAFYKPVSFDAPDAVCRRDFTLTPRQKQSDNFLLASVADVHIFDDAELELFRTTTLSDLVSFVDDKTGDGCEECIAVFCGDQMSDKKEMMPKFKALLQNEGLYTDRKLTFFQCIGNHDFTLPDPSEGLAVDTYNTSKTFVDNFGPTDYSFNIGKAHVVVMNNMIVTGSGVTRDNTVLCVSYKGGFTAEQLSWLKSDLAQVKNPAEKVIILYVHVPIKSSSAQNYQAVAQLLTPFSEAHIISGHTHKLENYIHNRTCAGGRKLYEHNVQMGCGTWWKSNLSVDGSPSGYSMMRFAGNRLLESVNKSVELDASHQIRVYCGDDVYGAEVEVTDKTTEQKETLTFSWKDELKGKFVARVWDCDKENWSVEFVQDGVSYPMTRVDAVVDEAAYAFNFHELHVPYGGWKTYKVATDTFWTFAPRSGDPKAETGWKIVAKHTPSPGWTLTYETSDLETSYADFASKLSRNN